jgi:hypothetical protein
MARLAAEADSVLMDLRSFSPSNQGCIFELQQLLKTVPLDRVVFLIDDTTDRAFLEQALQEAWARVGAKSPARDTSPAARLAPVSSLRARQITGLMRLLLATSETEAAAR